MSQHDFNIANQTFPATRSDINDAILAVVSNSSGDAEPSTTYANQWWYETDTNTLKIRNEANDGWVDVITLDASMTASASELSQLDAITRGSILYGNASGATARLAAGAASTVLTSDGTDISWATTSTGASEVIFPSDWGSPTNTYTSSGTWSKGSLADDDYVWAYLVGGGGGGGRGVQVSGHGVYADGGGGGGAMLLYTTAAILNGATYVIGTGATGSTTGQHDTVGSNSSLTLTAANGGTVYSPSNNLNFNLYAPYSYTVAIGSYGNFVVNISTENGIENTYSLPSGGNPIFGGGPNTQTAANQGNNNQYHCIFGGGGGHAQHYTGGNSRFFLADTSEYAGAGGTAGQNGAYPGGGGGGGSSAGQNGGNGANGNMRVYHV